MKLIGKPQIPSAALGGGNPGINTKARATVEAAEGTITASKDGLLFNGAAKKVA